MSITITGGFTMAGGGFTLVAAPPATPTAGWMMGFRKPSYKLSYTNFLTDYTTSSTTKIIYRCRLESESSYGNDVDNYFFLYIEDYNKNYVTDIVTSYTNKSYMGSNTMARIGITTNYYTVINDTAQDLVFKKREYFGPVNIDKLTTLTYKALDFR